MRSIQLYFSDREYLPYRTIAIKYFFDFNIVRHTFIERQIVIAIFFTQCRFLLQWFWKTYFSKIKKFIRRNTNYIVLFRKTNICSPILILPVFCSQFTTSFNFCVTMPVNVMVDLSTKEQLFQFRFHIFYCFLIERRTISLNALMMIINFIIFFKRQTVLFARKVHILFRIDIVSKCQISENKRDMS